MDDQKREDAADALRRLDAEDEPSVDREPTPGRWSRLRRQLQWLVLAMVGLGVVGFGAGWLFSQTSPPTASRYVLGDQVEVEDDVTEGGEPAPGADAAPTSGEFEASPRCGVTTAPVTHEEQLATLGAGGVAVQYRPEDVSAAERAEIEAIVDENGSHVLVAPNPLLDEVLVATAWQHRLELDVVNVQALRAFVDGYRRPSPDAPDCPH